MQNVSHHDDDEAASPDESRGLSAIPTALFILCVLILVVGLEAADMSLGHHLSASGDQLMRNRNAIVSCA